MTDTEDKRFDFIDDEEKALIESAEAHFGDPNFKIADEKEKSAINAKWREWLDSGDERKPITLRLQARDIERLKVIARQKGLPYQTLVSSVLHQFAAGDLIER